MELNKNLLWVNENQITEKIYSGYEVFIPLKARDWHPSKKMIEEFKEITGKDLEIEKIMEIGYKDILMHRRWTYNKCIYYDDITITDLLLWIIKKVFKLSSYKHFKMIFEREGG